LIGVTYLDHEEKLKSRMQWFGTISEFSRASGIRVKLRDSNEPCCLPPDDRGIRKAPPGTYRLSATGTVVVDPDYLATWTSVVAAPKK
jgi:hypothetical protein